MKPPGVQDAIEARRRIRPHVHETPLARSDYFDNAVGARVLFKCENLQKTGSFKARGATNAVFGLSDDEAARGVVAHSSGNHGQALAYAAGRRGVPSAVVMPAAAVESKRAAVREYGGRVVDCAATVSARQSAAAELVKETGAEFVHPYDDPRVIAGQATCALELLEQAGELDAIVVPIGGGGLASGTCVAVEAAGSRARIIGAEPSGADDAKESLEAGRIVPCDAPDTIADGLRTPLSDLTWQFISSRIDRILIADDRETVQAMKIVLQRMKMLVEPSAAVALAAVLGNAGLFSGKKVGIVLSGGNADVGRLPWTELDTAPRAD